MNRNLTSHTLVGSAWQLGSQGGQYAVSLLGTAILARLLSPSAFGQMGMAALLINFISTINELGLASAVVQRPDISNRALSTLFWINLVVGCALALLVAALAPSVAMFFQEPHLALLLRALGGVFFFAGLGHIQQALLHRDLAFQRLTIVNLASLACGMTLAVIVAFHGGGAWSLVVSALAQRAIAAALLWLTHPWRPTLTFSWSDIRDVSAFGLSLSAFRIVNYFARNADNIIIGRAFGPTQLAYYQNAYLFMYYPIQTLTSGFGNVLFSIFSRVQHDPARLRAAFLRATAATACMGFPVMAGLMVTADLVIATLLGPHWAPAARVLFVLAPIGLVQSALAPCGQIFLATGHTGLMFRWGLVVSLATVLAFLAGLPWNIEGIAAAYAVIQLLLLYPTLRIPLRLIGLSVTTYVRLLLPLLLVSMTMVIATLGLRLALTELGWTQPWLLLSASAVFGATIYVMLLWIVWPPALKIVLDALEGSDISFVTSAIEQTKRLRHRSLQRAGIRSVRSHQ